MVTALRAGASSIVAPAVLRDAAVERALRRMPTLATALHWLDAGTAPPADGPARWLLLPASSLVHTHTLEGLLADPAGRPVVLAGSTDPAAPGALARAGRGRSGGPGARGLARGRGPAVAARDGSVGRRARSRRSRTGRGRARGQALDPGRLQHGPAPSPPLLAVDHARAR